MVTTLSPLVMPDVPYDVPYEVLSLIKMKLPSVPTSLKSHHLAEVSHVAPNPTQMS